MRKMIDTTLVEVLSMTWPTLLIAIVLVATIRIGYLLKHRDEFIFYKEILYLCFMLYILCLFQLVTAEDLNATDGNNFTLFSEIFRYQFGGRLFFKNIIGNVLLFIPYGFFACYYVDLKSFFKALGLIFAASLSIEFTQLLIGRVFDVDDILLNVIGGMIGYFIYNILRKLVNRFKFLKNEIVLNVLTVLVLFLGILFLVWR